MKTRTAAFAFAAALQLLPSSAQAPAPALPPVEAFGMLPTMSDPALSPDGKRLALIQARNGSPVATVWTLDAAAGTAPIIIPFEKGFIVGVRWANDHRLLITLNLNARVLGDDVNPWFRTVSFDPDSRESVVMFSNKQDSRDINYSASNIADLAPDDPDHVYMSLWSGGGFVLGTYDEPLNTLFRVKVDTGYAQPVEAGSKRTREWFMDGGNLIARRDQSKDPLTDHILVRAPNGDWREIATADATSGGGFGVAGLTSDGKALALNASSDDHPTSGLVQMALADGKISPLYFNPQYDIDSTLTDPWTGRVIGVRLTVHTSTDIYFDPKLKAIQAWLENYFPAMTVHAESWDRAGNRFVVVFNGPITPPTYYLFDASINQIKRLGRAYSGLSTDDLGQVKIYDYKARDGLEIPAYLTLPPNKEAKNLPVVILPHGGPQARDSMNFDWESQFLANRGYAVLQPNFRGSSGYGRKFEATGYGQWGLKMQDDITDGVKKLIADGIADPKRICIAGGSYGGYATLSGAAFTPDLYALRRRLGAGHRPQADAADGSARFRRRGFLVDFG